MRLASILEIIFYLSAFSRKMTCGAAYKRRSFTHSLPLAHKYFFREKVS